MQYISLALHVNRRLWANRLYRKVIFSGLLIIAFAVLASYIATINFRYYGDDLYWRQLPLLFFYDGIFLGLAVVSVGLVFWGLKGKVEENHSK